MIILKDKWGQNKVSELVHIFTRKNPQWVGSDDDEYEIYEKYIIVFQFRTHPLDKTKYNEYVERTWWQVNDALGEKEFLKLVKTFYENHIHNKKTLV
tara:strand:+ start:1466 stop:1756 length:291 start_codon:yes stop_codon:yes gene_type:complete